MCKRQTAYGSSKSSWSLPGEFYGLLKTRMQTKHSFLTLTVTSSGARPEGGEDKCEQPTAQTRACLLPRCSWPRTLTPPHTILISDRKLSRVGNLSANAGVAVFQEWDRNILTGTSKDRGVLGGPGPDHSTPPARQPGQKGVHLKKPQRSGLPQNVNTCHEESWVPPKIRHQLPPGGETSPGNRAAGFSGRNPAVSTYIKAEDWVRFLGLLIRQHFGLRNVPVDSAKIYLLNSAQAHLCKSLANAGHSPAEGLLISSS